MTPAVSVVIATYNYGRFLAETLESVRRQTFADYEVVVVDDGSTDNTSAIIQPYLADRRLRYVCTEHMGQAAAKNRGIALARAPLVAFLDADDIWLPGKLTRQVERFQSDPELGVVYSRRLLIDQDGWQLTYKEPGLHRGDILDAMFLGNFICFSSSMVRRAVFERVGGFDERLALAVDYDLWLRVAVDHRFDYVDEPLVKYRVGHASLSRRVIERLHTACGIMQRFLDERGGRQLLDPQLVRLAFADTYYHLALERRSRARLRALPWYVRALRSCPTYLLAWQGLASLFMPEGGRRCMRRLLGRPADWGVRARIQGPARTVSEPAVPGLASLSHS
jgi:glycosyltransferase involved in cell wall biosynthesis